MRWEDLTWTEIPDALAKCGYLAVLPVGATEQHGPHLSCGMDTELADQLCARVAGSSGALLLPTLSFGCSIGHSHRWPGTIALQPKTLIDVVKDIGDWAHASGVRRLIIVNSHVTNAAPLRCALEMLRADHDDLMVAVVNSAHISERVRARHFADAEDWHANAAETALMQAIAPELVREDLLATADDPDRTVGCVFSHPVNRTSLHGVTGTPSMATPEDGRELFDWMVADLTALIRKAMGEEPPLPHGYNDTVQFNNVQSQNF